MTLIETTARANRRPKRSRVAAAEEDAVSVGQLRAMDVEDVTRLAERLNGAPVPGVRMSEREFVDWAFDHVDAEWADGEVYLMAPATDAHEGLDEWLGRLVGEFVERRGLGKLRRNMFVRLSKLRRRRVPDLMFIANAHHERIRPTFIDGPPDFVVEIVSADSQNRDRRDKYLEYAAARVREYWIIDPLSQTFDPYVLRGTRYVRTRPRDGAVHSAVLPGLRVRPEWLFGKRPTVAQVLKELGVKE